MAKRLILLDADIQCFQAASANEREYRWDDDIHTVHSDFKETWRSFQRKLDEIRDITKADRIVMVLSSNSNFRNELVYPDYKGNRKAKRKPLCLADLKAKVRDVFPVESRPSLEGDDVIGILMTDPQYMPDWEKVAVTLDKDFKTIPGLHYNQGHDEFFEIDDDTANLWLMRQTLSGDPTDGYPGCPGIGTTRAERILQDVPLADRWATVVATYEKAKQNEQAALTMARCARILHYEDYQDGKVILWNPPAKQQENA